MEQRWFLSPLAILHLCQWEKRRIIFSIRSFNMAKWNYWSHHILIWLLMYPIEKDRASERKVKRRVNETIACAHTAHANRLQSIYFSWHFTCSTLIHLWMGAASMNYRLFFLFFFFFSFTDWGGAFTHCMRIWLFAWFIFFFFFWLWQLRPN